MNMFNLYYYAGIPLASNLLFYSITSLSTSISSSQTVVKFITEHKDCDSVIFKNEIYEIDLENKLMIVESLVYDIIRKFSVDKEEFEKTKREIKNPVITENEGSDNKEKNGFGFDFEFAIIEVKNKSSVLDRIDEPIKLSLISTAETVQQIEGTLVDIRSKIKKHMNSYIKNFVSLSLKQELSKLHKHIKILDSRINILFELLKIYLPFVKRPKNK